jgi:hypothetical protein
MNAIIFIVLLLISVCVGYTKQKALIQKIYINESILLEPAANIDYNVSSNGSISYALRGNGTFDIMLVTNERGYPQFEPRYSHLNTNESKLKKINYSFTGEVKLTLSNHNQTHSILVFVLINQSDALSERQEKEDIDPYEGKMILFWFLGVCLTVASVSIGITIIIKWYNNRFDTEYIRLD